MSASSGSSTDGETITIPIVSASKTYSRASENVCMWTQQSSDACDSPRSCYDCLNASPSDGVQCVITSAGLCSTMSDYVWQDDYRRNSSASAPHFFPSANTTYCESDDPVCTACDSSQFIKSASGTTDPSQFCVGANGCVCVGFCESPVYANKVSSLYCSTLSDSTTVNVMGISVEDIITIVILCFTIPVVVYLWWMRRLRRRREARDEAYRNRPPVNGPLLPLVGWKKYRADLIASQTAIIGAANTDEESVTLREMTGTAVESIDIVATSTTLANLDVAHLSVEFEDPEHPLTAVTRTGRRRSSLDNTNVVRMRPSDTVMGSSEESEDEQVDARATPYSQLEEQEESV